MAQTDTLTRGWRSLQRAGFDAERRAGAFDAVIVTVPGLESRLLGPFADQPFFRHFDDRFVITRSRSGVHVALDYWRPVQLLLHGTAAAVVPLAQPALLSTDSGDLLTVACWIVALQLALIGVTLLLTRGPARRIREIVENL